MATGPGDEQEAAGQGHLRASHADREQAIDTLKVAFIQGRITRDELDLRVGQALASRTYGDLAALTADIPARLTRVRAAEPARESADKKKKAVVALACATPAIPGLLVALPPVPDGSPVAVLLIVLICVWGMAVGTGWLLLFRAWLDKHAGRPPAQGLPPGGDGQASQHSLSAAPGPQLPPANPGCQHTAEAARTHRRRPALPGSRSPRHWRPHGLLAGQRPAITRTA
jgi:hypothetical protein